MFNNCVFKKVFLFLMCLTVANCIHGQNNYSIDGLFYHITGTNKVEVVGSGFAGYRGNVIIPSTVTISGNDYSVSSIGIYAFANCSSLTGITIPNTVTTINVMAFASCSALPTLTIPVSVVSIGNSAFQYCSALKSITIPNAVTSIENNTFAGCYNLNTISIPGSVVFIGNNAFSNCNKLTDINIPASVALIGESAFANTGSIKVDANNINFISQDGVLYDKDKKTLIHCPINASGSFEIPSTVRSISASAFESCKSLTNIIIPNTVSSIGKSAFYACSGLTSIAIPDSVTSIEDYTFSSCFGFSNIHINQSINSIGVNAFASCKGPFTVEIDNFYFSSLSGVLYDKTKKILLQCPNSTSGNFVIPSSVNVIGNMAFSNCINLTKIIIPESVDSIKEAAFFNCRGLTTFSIPSSVKYLGNGLFSSCINLNSIYTYATTPVDLSLNYDIFYDIDKTLCKLYVPKGSLDLYETASKWKDFNFIIEFDATAVNNTKSNSINLFYNPSNSTLQIKGIEHSLRVSIYNLNGILSFNQMVNTGEIIPLDTLPKGIYIIKIKDNDNEINQKIIVK